MIEDEIFKKCIILNNKLLDYGFIEDKDYKYEKFILNNEFTIIINIKNNKVKGTITDNSTKEEYTNFRLKNPGEFASTIKEEYIKLLLDIKNNCTKTNPFHFNQSNRITEWIKEKYCDDPEFLWDDDVNGVFRNHNNKKWYGIIMYISKNKLDFGEEKVEVMNVKLPEELINELVNKNGYYRAYHMNKKYWISFILNETINDEELEKLIDISYQYTLKNKNLSNNATKSCERKNAKGEGIMNDLKYVVDNSKYVHIDKKNIDKFINDLGYPKYTHWSKEFDLKLNEKEWIILCIIIESMNFCFWRKPKWKVEFKGDIVSGSNALFDAVIKAVSNDKELLKIDNLNNITKKEFTELLKGVEGECPLIEERYNNFKEAVNTIKQENFFQELFSIKSDIELLNFITKKFKSFDDKSEYKGKTIHFNKRATLLTNDLFYVSKTINKNIGNVNNLRGCADYGIPRTFRDYGMLIYCDELIEKIDNEIEIPHDSEMEIEIRGNMLYIIEMIKEKLKEKNIIINSVELDNIIWWMGKKMKDRSNSHHTVTIYY